MGVDWEAARRRDMGRAASHRTKHPRSGTRDGAILRFAAQHQLRCFVCDKKDGPWAKTGVSARGPWGMCVPCVSRQSG